ncbi:MAG: hypothetical protein WD766_11400 [Gemmatimonadota bacterium]
MSFSDGHDCRLQCPSKASARRELRVAAVLLALCGTPPALSAQAAPVLTGTVEIDLPRGAIAADVCLNALPARGDTLSFVLNRAYTIKRITGADDRTTVVTLEPGGEGLRYTLMRAESSGSSREAEPLCLEYGGSHPVYDIESGEFRTEDASNVVAFNGRSLRARGVSRWYPAPYDPATGLAAEALAFRLVVNCEACERIYVNGGRATDGPRGEFMSREPREMLLLAGDLPESRVDGVLILGETVPAEPAVAFVSTLRRIQRFFGDYLTVPFGADPHIIRIDALRAPKEGRLWGFFSDPALVLIGMTVPEYVEIFEGPATPARRAVVGFVAHELAHRYFGWKIGTHSAQRDLFGEPFATYLELKAVRELLGESDYRAGLEALNERAGAVSDHRPLDEAGPDDFNVGGYRYGFAPLQLFALERTIGEARMRSLLTRIITAPPHERASADYAFLHKAALDVGVTEREWQAWETRCVRKRGGDDDCLRLLGR